MAVIKLTNENFKDAVANGRVLVDFYADWCGPCRMVGQILEEIAADNPDITIGKVNVDEQEALAREFGIVSIPTLVVMDSGKPINKIVGARPKSAILDLIKE